MLKNNMKWCKLVNSLREQTFKEIYSDDILLLLSLVSVFAYVSNS